MTENTRNRASVAEEILTPAFVFDIAAVRNRADFISGALGKRFKLCYAIKANPFLIPELMGKIERFEVCSPGEYRICERACVPPEKIVLSGVYKEPNDIARIVDNCGDKTLYTVESVSQFDLLCRLVKEKELVLPVILRLSSGNQFGMDRATVERLIARGEKSLDIVGLQLYSGTQKKTEKIRLEIENLLGCIGELKLRYGFDCRRIEYGPGLGVSYFTGEPPRDDKAALEAVRQAFSAAPENAEIVLEMGRFLVAHCGEYHTKVVDLKTTEGVNYCIVDGGINHLNYYGQVMAMKHPFISVERVGGNRRANAECGVERTVCGSLCTTADVLVKNYPLPDIELGDKLIFRSTGAYSVTEGIYLFLSRDMPRIYKRDELGALRLVRDEVRTDVFNG